MRAAQALEKAFRARGDCDAEQVDALDYTSKLFQKLYEEAYIAMVRHAPGLMGFLHDRTDTPWKHMRRRLALDRLNTSPMIGLLERVRPDLCVATHFLPAEIIACLNAKRKVALDEAAEYLTRIGVPRENLRVIGIPIDPVFAEPADRLEMKRRHGLDLEAKTVVLSARGYGVGPIERRARDLVEQNRPWQIVAIAGKAEKVKPRLGDLARRTKKLPSGAPGCTWWALRPRWTRSWPQRTC